MNNTDWNLDGLDGLFFDTSNKVASGGDGYEYDIILFLPQNSTQMFIIQIHLHVCVCACACACTCMPIDIIQ